MSNDFGVVGASVVGASVEGASVGGFETAVVGGVGLTTSGTVVVGEGTGADAGTVVDAAAMDERLGTWVGTGDDGFGAAVGRGVVGRGVVGRGAVVGRVAPAFDPFVGTGVMVGFVVGWAVAGEWFGDGVVAADSPGEGDVDSSAAPSSRIEIALAPPDVAVGTPGVSSGTVTAGRVGSLELPSMAWNGSIPSERRANEGAIALGDIPMIGAEG